LRRTRHRHDQPRVRHAGGAHPHRRGFAHPAGTPRCRDRRPGARNRPPVAPGRRALVGGAAAADPVRGTTGHRPDRPPRHHRGAGYRAHRTCRVHHGPTAAGRVVNVRVQPGDRRTVGLFTWLLAKASGVVTGTRPPRLFLVLGKHRRLFHGWLFFAARLMPGGLLPRRDTELVILRVAHLRGSEYEFEQHRRLGGRAGVHSRDVDRLVAGPEAAGFSDRERTLLTVAD